MQEFSSGIFINFDKKFFSTYMYLKNYLKNSFWQGMHQDMHVVIEIKKNHSNNALNYFKHLFVQSLFSHLVSLHDFDNILANLRQKTRMHDELHVC